MSDDPHRLHRFVTAQDDVWPTVLAELAAGHKRTHWMWFVFPQFAGLGFSETARHFAIGSLAEARAYIGHPVLGPRLLDCTTLTTHIQGRSVFDIFGSPDDLKFHSSMTLFAQLEPTSAPFDAALRQFFDCEPDRRTLELLARTA